VGTLHPRIQLRAPDAPEWLHNNVDIIQTRDTVAMLTEMIHDVRVVPLDGRPHGQTGSGPVIRAAAGREILSLSTPLISPAREPGHSA